MDLIEALKRANGKPVRRKGWDNDGSALMMNQKDDLIWAESKDVATLCRDSFFADDWYVVEPKSKIEEAIEQEAADYFTGDIRFAERSAYADAIRRIVNLALDEAKKAAFDCSAKQGIEERIDALKVKE